jgi:DedD protein
MALPSFFKRKDPPPPAPADLTGDETGPVQAARTRARRRLIGAVLLLAIGVVVFPMLFETQPRPLPADIPIELPRREAAAPRVAAAAPRAAPAVTELPVPEPAPSAPAIAPSPAVAAEPAAASAAPPAAPPATTTVAPVSVATAPAVAPPARAASRPETPPPAPARTPEAPKKAEHADKPEPAAPAASDAKGGRFVVQVGAYTDANTLRDVRAKVERLGLKTYTQSVDTEAGKRTRVRVGPFATRQEAEAASGKLKGAGLPGNVLVL